MSFEKSNYPTEDSQNDSSNARNGQRFHWIKKTLEGPWTSLAPMFIIMSAPKKRLSSLP